MASTLSIGDMPSEILGSIFEHLSNDDLVKLPSNLVTKGLSSSAAKSRFQPHEVWLNKDSMGSLCRLSRHPFLVNIIEKLVVHTERPAELTTNDFLELQWRKHLSDYGQEGKIPPCVTMGDVHKAVGIKNWRDCKTCGGLSPQEQQSRLIRAAKAEKKLKSPAVDVASLSCAFRRLSNVHTIVIDNVDHDVFGYGTAVQSEDGDNFDAASRKHLMAVLLKALGTSGLRPKVLGTVSQWQRNGRTRRLFPIPEDWSAV